MATQRPKPHLFFDTTEVKSPDPRRPLGRISAPRLRKTASANNATLYVSALVVEEIAYQRYREFDQTFQKLAPIIRPYVSVGVPPTKDELLNVFRQETEHSLGDLSVIVIPMSVTLDEVLALSKEKLPPLAGKKLEGFHDAVIFLSSVKYAREHEIEDECWFVSEDSGFDANSVREEAAKYGLQFRLVSTALIASDLMEKMRRSRVYSLEADLPRATLAFMREHLGAVEQYLNGPEARERFGAWAYWEFGRGSWLEQFATISIDVALPNDPLAGGSGDCPLTFYGMVSGAIAQQWGPQPIMHEFSTSYIGKASAEVRGGRFIGQPRVEWIKPHGKNVPFTVGT